jgi:hypothetical protein
MFSTMSLSEAPAFLTNLTEVAMRTTNTNKEQQQVLVKCLKMFRGTQTLETFTTYDTDTFNVPEC